MDPDFDKFHAFVDRFLEFFENLSDYSDLYVLAGMLLFGLVFGSRAEKKHYKSIRLRETDLAWLAVRCDEFVTEGNQEAWMVTASVVVANDYFKNYIARIKNVFGGRLTSYESLMDRARREVVLRIKERALERGAKEVIGLDLQFNVLDKVGVEIFASATAIR